ncbi:hypothetical protein [Sphingopyxis sp.]|uniref:hypothetical protein n=1 Tax=Sphingopyxis sp. TaxID=1908224 RepID=UPI0035B12BF4
MLAGKCVEQSGLASEDFGHEEKQLVHPAAPFEPGIKLCSGLVKQGQVAIDAWIANSSLSGLGEELK